jgi:hypothetical protein
MARPREVDPERQYDTYSTQQIADAVAGQVVLLAVPLDTFQRLNDEAAKRGVSAASLINIAVDKYIAATDPARHEPLRVVLNKENS